MNEETTVASREVRVNMRLADLPEVQAVYAERDRLRAAVDAALALHGRSKIQGWCNGCTDRYPCATVRALAPVADPDPHTTSDEEM
jgi:hypothetical protein